MLAHAVRGDTRPPVDIPAEVSRCLATVWPHLLAASNAIDGPDPAQAREHLRAAARALLAAADRIP